MLAAEEETVFGDFSRRLVSGDGSLAEGSDGDTVKYLWGISLPRVYDFPPQNDYYKTTKFSRLLGANKGNLYLANRDPHPNRQTTAAVR